VTGRDESGRGAGLGGLDGPQPSISERLFSSSGTRDAKIQGAKSLLRLVVPHRKFTLSATALLARILPISSPARG
jgi:hypothetical protein